MGFTSEVLVERTQVGQRQTVKEQGTRPNGVLIRGVPSDNSLTTDKFRVFVRPRPNGVLIRGVPLFRDIVLFIYTHFVRFN